MVEHNAREPNPLSDREPVWRRYGVRRASQRAESPSMASGWPALDAVLPGGGFPLGAVTELLVENTGIGDLSLLLPCLAQRMAVLPGYQVGLVAPPHALQASALAAFGLNSARLPVVHCNHDSERIWAVEQMALSKAFAAVVLWCDRATPTALRRLQLAAEQSLCAVFVYRTSRQSRHASPAALRLLLSARGDAQRIEVLKCRGPAGAIVHCLRQGETRPWQGIESAPHPGFATLNTQADNDVARSVFHPFSTGHTAPLRSR